MKAEQVQVESTAPQFGKCKGREEERRLAIDVIWAWMWIRRRIRGSNFLSYVALQHRAGSPPSWLSQTLAHKPGSPISNFWAVPMCNSQPPDRAVLLRLRQVGHHTCTRRSSSSGQPLCAHPSRPYLYRPAHRPGFLPAHTVAPSHVGVDNRVGLPHRCWRKQRRVGHNAQGPQPSVSSSSILPPFMPSALTRLQMLICTFNATDLSAHLWCLR